MNSWTKLFKQIAMLCVVAVLCVACVKTPALESSPWQSLQLPTQSNLQDLAFAGNLRHGWVVGSDATLLETNDGGQTWENRQLELNDQKYRFNSISFKGDEGWIVGEPAIMLHTTDGGQHWENLPLSAKLPGAPSTVTALDKGSAEMTTNVGAIYRTSDGGKNWKAMVNEAVGLFRSIARSTDGKYVAVSAKGNFYSVWKPGNEAWEPHNRNSSRRVSSMGFTRNGDRLWMLARGGQLQFSSDTGAQEWDEAVFPGKKDNIGLLDLAYRTPEEIWVSGGSSNLMRSLDGGQTWEKDYAVQDVPSNLYKIIFFTPEQGFIIGQKGILLKYQGSGSAAAPAA
jgi:photosystem II stability/assembly factor-like uncharacterized protein